MRLTPRQQQIVQLAADELTAQEIADRLEPRCDVRTVEAHVAAIAAKIRASDYRFQRGGLRLIRRWWKDQLAA